MFFRFLATLIAAYLFVFNPAHSFEIESEMTFPADNPQAELNIISTADLKIFTPILLAYQARNPNVSIHYVVTSSTELFKAIYTEGKVFDLVISSAMDLQIKIANDGKASEYVSVSTSSLPDWAHWRNEVFAFTWEPAVLLISRSAFSTIPIPTTRTNLIELLRDHPEIFKGRIGTYDVRRSGLGYLFATQDSRNSEVFWRLTETFGQLGTKLYCCSSDLISDIERNKLAVAYNVLGSYAAQEIKQGLRNTQIVEFEDFTTVMLRTVLIPANASNRKNAGQMVDFLMTLDRHSEMKSKAGLPYISQDRDYENRSADSIHLGPSLLVYLDNLKRARFVNSWSSSMRLNKLEVGVDPSAGVSQSK